MTKAKKKPAKKAAVVWADSGPWGSQHGKVGPVTVYAYCNSPRSYTAAAWSKRAEFLANGIRSIAAAKSAALELAKLVAKWGKRG